MSIVIYTPSGSLAGYFGTNSMTHHNNDSPSIVRSVQSLRQRVTAWRAEGLRIGFVPTMGALHEGHLSLIRLARKRADRCVASIFVNPTQFAANEDLGAYPRREAEDLAMLHTAGCDLAFLPDVEEMYPAGFSTSVSVDGLTDMLCGASRPTHFGGVATVVTKLMNQVRPDIAVFGEKDYQQLLVIRRLTDDLDLGADIIGGPILREEDGLAMSSRNAYLTAPERRVAGQLNLILRKTGADIASGEAVQTALETARGLLAQAGFDRVDYLELRSGKDLTERGPDTLSPGHIDDARLFAAVYLGKTRLIDNMALSDIAAPA